MSKNSGIYKIVNIINGKFYLGSSKNLLARNKKHKYHLSKGTHHSSYLQNAYNKYGGDNFKFIVVEYVDEDRLLETEQQYLDKWEPYLEDVGYNMSRNATNCVLIGENHWTYGLPKESHHWYGKKHTEETKKKISDAQKGELNHMYGKTYKLKTLRTSEWKRKQSESHKGQVSGFKGKTHSEKTKKIMSQKAIGRPVPEKVINKSDEWIANISKGKKGKGLGKDNPNAIKIVKLNNSEEIIKIYDTVTQASKDVNGNLQSIVNCCRGRNKTSAGYKWMYYEDYIKLNNDKQLSIS